MADRWFFAGAFKGSKLEPYADVIFDIDVPLKRKLNEIDVFFAETEKERNLVQQASSHTLVLECFQDDETISNLLMAFPGRDFLSRLGHDVVNLFSPLTDYQYLSPDTIIQRVERGTRLGQQLNIAGHLMQNDISATHQLDINDFALNFKLLCNQQELFPQIEITGSDAPDFFLGPEKVVASLINELIANWKMHANGDEQLFIDKKEKTLLFINRTGHTLNYQKPMALLRRPFFKMGNNNGNGLGLFILSLASVIGGFSWDLRVKDSYFYLSLRF